MRAQAHHAGDFAPLRLTQLGVLFRDDLERPFLRLIEQILQPHGVAGARFEGLAVLTQDGTEPDVGQLEAGLRMPAAEDGEQLHEVQLLPRVRHVNDLVRPRAPGSPLPSEEQRGQVCGGVIEAAVALAHQRRMVLQLREVGKKDHHRPFARLGQAALGQFVHHRFQHGVVGTFPEAIIEFHSQPRIDAVELRLGERDHLPPEAEVLRVAGLQFDQFLARSFQHLGVAFALRR